MARQHHQLHEHEFEQTLGDGERQGSQVYCSPWGHKEPDDLVTVQQYQVEGMKGIVWLTI